jgi:hypothetical protein
MCAPISDEIKSFVNSSGSCGIPCHNLFQKQLHPHICMTFVTLSVQKLLQKDHVALRLHIPQASIFCPATWISNWCPSATWTVALLGSLMRSTFNLLLDYNLNSLKRSKCLKFTTQPRWEANRVASQSNYVKVAHPQRSTKTITMSFNHAFRDIQGRASFAGWQGWKDCASPTRSNDFIFSCFSFISCGKQLSRPCSEYEFPSMVTTTSAIDQLSWREFRQSVCRWRLLKMNRLISLPADKERGQTVVWELPFSSHQR